jgi:hypothetical protein
MRRVIIRAVLLLSLAGIVYACIHDEFALDEDSSAIEEAQQWYEGYKKDPVNMKSVSEVPDMLIKPQWQHVSVTRKDDYEAVEISIVSERGFGFIDPECMKKYEETKDNRYLQSNTRMVILKNRRTNDMEGFLMTVVPGLAYLESTNFHPFRTNTYLNRDKKYNGYIFYHDLEGQFVNGWRYVDGTAYSMSTREKISRTTQLRIDCDPIIVQYFISECDGFGETQPDGSLEFVILCNRYNVYAIYLTDCYSGGGLPGDGWWDGLYLPGGGGGGGGNSGNNNTQTAQAKLCNAYHGVLNIADLKNAKNDFTPHQEMFIISLANLAAMNELGYSLESLKTDLVNYPTSNSLYTKYNKLIHPERYITNWASAGNSSSNSDVAYVSLEIGNSGLQLKYYPEKNGEYNALGLVKEGLFDHSVEAALELLEYIDVKYAGFPDDYLYDMHLFNALNFMEYYCDD